MRIALLSDASVIHTHRWGEALASRGHQIELASLEPGAGYGFPLRRIQSRVPLRFLRYPLAAPRVRAWLARFRPDVVNAHFVPNYGLIGVLAGFRPLVVSVWGSDVLISGRKSPLHRARARYVLRRADAITTDAEMLTRAAVELGADGARVLTVPMGVDLAVFERGPAHAPGGDAVVVSTRKLEPVYNVGLLVNAVPRVLAERSDVRFVIVGDGPERRGYEERVRPCRHAVEFRGMIPHAEMAATLAEGDVYVSTSLSDSTSVSLLEAMAAGNFPVVTDIEANREWIEDGVNGFLVPADEPAALASRIVAALSDPSLRERARRYNREVIRQRANWSDNMTKVENLLAEQVRAYRERSSGAS